MRDSKAWPRPSCAARAARGDGRHEPLLVPYHVDGREEALLYLEPARRAGRLRGASRRVHGGRLARAHAARLGSSRCSRRRRSRVRIPPRSPTRRGEVELIRELIDDILFLSELETARAVVALGETRAPPFVSEVLQKLGRPQREPASRSEPRATRRVRHLRLRMLRVLTENLAQNAIRHAGPGSTFTITVCRRASPPTTVSASPRRTCRGSSSGSSAPTACGLVGPGLGLAVVAIVAAANGTVEVADARARPRRLRAAFHPRDGFTTSPAGRSPPDDGDRPRMATECGPLLFSVCCSCSCPPVGASGRAPSPRPRPPRRGRRSARSFEEPELRADPGRRVEHGRAACWCSPSVPERWSLWSA